MVQRALGFGEMGEPLAHRGQFVPHLTWARPFQTKHSLESPSMKLLHTCARPERPDCDLHLAPSECQVSDKHLKLRVDASDPGGYIWLSSSESASPGSPGSAWVWLTTDELAELRDAITKRLDDLRRP